MGFGRGCVRSLAIGNGRQAGGGIPLCPDALIDDGLLDLLIVPKIDLTAGREPMTVRARSPWIEFEADEDVSISIDGEPDQVRGFRAECRSRALPVHLGHDLLLRSEEHTSELQSLMRISYAVFCLNKKKPNNTITS